MLFSTRGARARRPRTAPAFVVHAPAASQSGVTAGIDDRGALLVRVGEQVERIVAGELTWL